MQFTFGAQFGGRDVAHVLFPHLQALRALSIAEVSEPTDVPSVQELAYLLRGDGSVNTYGLEGYGYLEYDRRDKAISVDIGVPVHRWQQKSPAEIASFLVDSMIASLPEVEVLAAKHRLHFDRNAAERHILERLGEYRANGV